MYRNLNDYEVLYMVCENNNFNILYEKYKPLIYKIVKEYSAYFKKFGYEIDDLMQIGYITLYKSSYLYKEYSSAKFYTYLNRAIRNAINTELRNNKTSKREILNEALSYDNNLPNSNYTYADILPDTKLRIDLTEGKNNFILFKNSLSFLNGAIFEMYYNGFQIDEISILLDENKSLVLQSLDEIKKFAMTHKNLW